MSQFVKVCNLSDLPNGQGRQFDVEAAGAYTLALFQIDGAVYALDDTCPHRGGPLSDGDVQDCIVSCPWHNARFDLRNGAALGPLTTTAVRTYATRIVDGVVEVEL